MKILQLEATALLQPQTYKSPFSVILGNNHIQDMVKETLNHADLKTIHAIQTYLNENSGIDLTSKNPEEITLQVDQLKFSEFYRNLPEDIRENPFFKTIFTSLAETLTFIQNETDNTIQIIAETPLSFDLNDATLQALFKVFKNTAFKNSQNTATAPKTLSIHQLLRAA